LWPIIAGLTKKKGVARNAGFLKRGMSLYASRFESGEACWAYVNFVRCIDIFFILWHATFIPSQTSNNKQKHKQHEYK